MGDAHRSPWRLGPTRGAAFADLPAALLARGRERLARAALAAFGLILATQAFTALWYLRVGDEVHHYAPPGDLLSAGFCLLLWGLCRIRGIGDAMALKLGLAGEVLVCASVSSLGILSSYELFGRPSILNLSPIVIAIFPLVVPANPRITLWISLLAALTAPLSVFVIDAASLYEVRTPIADAIAVGTMPLLSVVVAFAASRSLYEAYVDVDELRQEQALLEALLEQVGTAVILADAEQRLVYANGTARELLLRPEAPQGEPLEAALHERVKALGPAWSEERDATLTLMVGGEPEVLQIVRRKIEVGFRPHELLVARRVTEALRTREIAAYKRVVRVIMHEVNNSLGPIGSTLGSAQRVLGNPQHAARLQSTFAVVRERLKSLGEFLEGYARLARLPAPRPARVAWGPFLAEVRGLHPFQLAVEPPMEDGYFDQGQLQQVLLNLLKNAEEAGSPAGETEVEVSREGEDVCVRVSDRGSGLSDEAWRHAMTPLFSTKPKGSGLGLALCREILDAHGGRLGLFPREGGGTTVRCWLPRAANTGQPSVEEGTFRLVRPADD